MCVLWCKILGCDVKSFFHCKYKWKKSLKITNLESEKSACFSYSLKHFWSVFSENPSFCHPPSPLQNSWIGHCRVTYNLQCFLLSVSNSKPRLPVGKGHTEICLGLCYYVITEKKRFHFLFLFFLRSRMEGVMGLLNKQSFPSSLCLKIFPVRFFLRKSHN